jgi:hypothetical protein
MRRLKLQSAECSPQSGATTKNNDSSPTRQPVPPLEQLKE